MSRKHSPTPRTLVVRNSNATRSTKRFRSAWRCRFWCGLLFAPLAFWWVVSSAKVVRAERALGKGDFQDALMLATQELQADHKSERALMVAGSACLALRNLVAAKSFFSRVSTGNPQFFSLAQRELGRIALDAGGAAEAEVWMRKSLQIVPNDPTTLDQLIYLLTLEGRSWEARGLVLERLRSGIVTTNSLLIAGTNHPSLGSAIKCAEYCLGTGSQ